MPDEEHEDTVSDATVAKVGTNTDSMTTILFTHIQEMQADLKK